MDSNFTIKTDELRLIYSIFFLIGSIFAVIVAIRVLQQNEESQSDNCCDIKHQVQHLEKHLQKLKDTL